MAACRERVSLPRDRRTRLMVRGLGPLDLQRLSHELHVRGCARSARLVKAVIFLLYHAVLPPELEAGAGLGLNHHGFGVVIHPNTTLGENVKLHHHVTIGTDVVIGSSPRRIIEDGVTIGAGAIVLGPGRIGEGSYIGAGAVVRGDVAPWCVVAGNPARVIRERSPQELAEERRTLAF